jgi:hypothetical protein
MIEVTKEVKADLDTVQETLGLRKIYYGRQGLIPEFPALEVETGPKIREIIGFPQFRVVYTVLLTLFHMRMDMPAEWNQEESERLAEAIEEELHKDLHLNNGTKDLVIFGFVTRVEPVIIAREEVKMRATRLEWAGQTREQFT